MCTCGFGRKLGGKALKKEPRKKIECLSVWVDVYLCVCVCVFSLSSCGLNVLVHMQVSTDIIFMHAKMERNAMKQV